MRSFTITNTASGVVLGTYEAASEEEALNMMAQDAGYADYAAACEVSLGDDIVVTEA